MATRAEAFRAQQERKGVKKRTSAKKPKKSTWSRESAHAAAKATRAFEPTASGERPSRESTRASANRAKGDTAMNLTEERRKGSPENRARRARARRTKVRGS
jgi:hypothetical protein